jgi:hypothetical protein
MRTPHIRDRCPATVNVLDAKGNPCDIQCGMRNHSGKSHDFTIVWDEHDAKFPSFLSEDGAFYAGKPTP